MAKYKNDTRSEFEGCQLVCIPSFASGLAPMTNTSMVKIIKRRLASEWNNSFKRWLKSLYKSWIHLKGPTPEQKAARAFTPKSKFEEGEMVKVRSKDEILSTLDPFNELKGCSFLPHMFQYCGTNQKVFRVMKHFLEERDYKMKKTRGIILLENVFCEGTAVFGKCDRSCFLFWREEWLEKIQ